MSVWDTIRSAYSGYWDYLVYEVTHPGWHNYFYYLLGISVVIWIAELLWPWRKKQAAFRKDFWLDAWYMLFNFFLFSLIGFNALSMVGVDLFNRFLGLFGVTNLVAVEIGSWPAWSQMLLLFIVADFIQWNVHRLLHRIPWLWEFHKVHHSVEQMGFAAHLRYHWMESIVYKSIQYVPLAMIGFSVTDFIQVHMIAILIGHLNHSNLAIGWGPLGYIFNSPKMHIWHHARELPRPYGVNFGISLSLWDYLFGSAYIPSDGRDIELGVDDQEQFPRGFLAQIIYPFKSRKS